MLNMLYTIHKENIEKDINPLNYYMKRQWVLVESHGDSAVFSVSKIRQHSFRSFRKSGHVFLFLYAKTCHNFPDYSVVT